MVRLSAFLALDLFMTVVYSHLGASTWDMRVICDVPDIQKVTIFYLVKAEAFNLRVLSALSILNPSHIPSLSVAPTMTHLAYIRIYLTPKNKKRIIWTAANKTSSYSNMPCSCFPSFWGLFDASHLGVSQNWTTANFSVSVWLLYTWSTSRKFQCLKAPCLSLKVKNWLYAILFLHG